MWEGSGNNYAYIVTDDKTKDAVVIDPANPSEVLPTLKKTIDSGVNLKSIINTHHHHDHAGGNAEMLQSYPLPIIGGKDCSKVSKTPAHNEEFSVGNIKVKALHTPCHTQDSICFFFEDGNERAVFTGDTLFIGGCGRFFEGTPEEMDKALNQTLAALPDDTKVYPGHEYTKGNVKFGIKVMQSEPIKKLEAFVNANKQTQGKFTIGDEKEHNVFMKLDALSDFADYVQQQQALRKPPITNTSTTSSGNSAANASKQEHAELDILDTLDLADDKPKVRLKDLFLDEGETKDDSIKQLFDFIVGRIDEGHGECLFDVGLEDNGDTQALTEAEWDAALARIHGVLKPMNANIRPLITKNVPDSAVDVGNELKKERGCVGKFLIRRQPEEVDNVIETRIAVVGNVDAGKSTLLGVLVKGGLDDGRGRMRVNLFRHKHEMESGRTSSVGMEIMGFDTKGEVVVSGVPGRKLSWEEIGKRSAKVISFTDLAGHERYLRTTVFGLLSSEPNYCLLMVAANNGLIGMSKEHLGIALALNVPVMVVITKIDICPPHILQQTLTQLQKILKSPGARKIPIFIKNREECVNTASQFISQRICPIFQVSNVTGESLDMVREFLNILPHHGKYDPDAPFEFHVNDTFSVPFVGTVVSGVVKSGVVHAGDTVLVGPDSLGQFTTTTVRSIERKRIPVPACSAGQSASFALRRVRRKDVRKGMVVLLAKSEANPNAPISQPKVYREFVAEVLILSHATTIRTKYQAMLHVGPISQTCAIIDIDRAYIRTGDRATVAFRFVQRPEFLAVGDRILFREGRTKGLGIVKQVGYDTSKPLNAEAVKEREKMEEDRKAGVKPSALAAQ
ncbi:P-loop containing nucleoside triphosphate hydrolase protein [Hortaea werneckii]|nr:P-loop containing nucleoside triphosphate hydrolase protein [Hortaea werneckii]KAI7707447.1 P-loop containing nucleoside triphosphate hydrolase protein [Hortaea werneckii]